MGPLIGRACIPAAHDGHDVLYKSSVGNNTLVLKASDVMHTWLKTVFHLELQSVTYPWSSSSLTRISCTKSMTSLTRIC